MKKLLVGVLFCLPAFGQAVYSGHNSYTGQASFSVASSGSLVAFAQLPQLWVHNPVVPDAQPNKICDLSSFAVDGTLGSGVYASYSVTVAGLQAAMNTWTGSNQGIKVPAGALLNSATYTTSSGTSPLGLSYSQSTLIDIPVISNPTGCLVVESSSPPTRYQMLCSHGLPLPGGGTRDPNCTSDLAHLWTIRQDDNPGNVSYNAIYFPPGSNHVVIRDFEATILPGTSQSDSGGDGRTPVQADVEAFAVGIEYFWIHGWDPGDTATARGWDGQPGAGSGNSAVDAVTGACKNWNLSGTVNTVNADGSHGTVTGVSGHHFGMTFSDGMNLYGQTYVNNQATITINGVGYTISNHDPAASDTTLTVNGQPGTQTAVAYSLQNLISKYTPGCGDDLNDGIKWNADNSWIMWGQINKHHYWQTENHAILLGFQNGPVKIAHNWVEGGATGLFVGGGPVDTRLGPVNDLEIRDNYFGRDLNYRFLDGSQNKSPHPPFGSGPLDQVAGHDNSQWAWAIKNSFEFKFCVRCLVDGNIIQGDWPDGQDGQLIINAARVCSGGTLCGIFQQNGRPREGIRDVRFSNNWMSSAAAGANTQGRSGLPGLSGGGMSFQATNVDWFNNVWSNFDTAEFGDNVGNNSIRLLDLGSSGQSYLCTMTRTGGVAHCATVPVPVKVPNSGTSPSSITRVGTPGVAGGTVTVKFATGSNSQRHDPCLAPASGHENSHDGTQGCVGGGIVTVAVTGSGSSNFDGTFHMNGGFNGDGVSTICSNDASPWLPPTNYPCIDTNGRYANQFTYIDNVNANVSSTDTLCSGNCNTSVLGTNSISFSTLAYMVTDISVGDPIVVFSGSFLPNGNANHNSLGMGCQDGSSPGAAATYPTTGITSYANGYTSLPLAIAPTNPAGLDVYYSNPGSDDNSGVQCYLDNGGGSATDVSFQNNTIIGGSALNVSNNQFYSQETYNVFANNVYVAPDASTGVCVNKKSFIISGAISGTNCEGTYSYKSFDPLTFGLYGNVLQGRTASNWCASPSGITCPGVGGAALNYFPANFSDVGFATTQAQQSGGCTFNTGPFNCPQMSLPWANNLKLSDLVVSGTYAGKGVDTSAMSNAFNANVYTCPAGLSCGSSGPFKDAP